MKGERIGIVGGGFAGLTLAWKLAKENYPVTVFEKKGKVGGLATSFKKKSWSWPLDHFYRHVFASDKEFLQLAKDLKVADKVFFRRPKTSVYFKSKIYPFDSPSAILAFPHLNPWARFRLGFGTAILKYLPYSKLYEKVLLSKGLPFLVGRQGYRRIWQPLIGQKFGQYADMVPLAWFWARVRARTASLGYFEGSFGRLAQRLERKINQAGGRVKKNFPVEKVTKIGGKFVVKAKNKIYRFDKVVLTTPLPVSLKIAGDLLEKEKEKYASLKTFGAAVLVLRLKDKFLPDDTYWLNVLEKDWPFVAVIEQTNFVNRKNYRNETIIYFGGYYS